MKKRRTIIIAMLLVAALALGIGYAAQSATLVVNGRGNLEVDSTAFKLEFISAEDGVEGDDHVHARYSESTATFDVSHIDTKDESITFTYQFKNTSSGKSTLYIDQVITPTSVRLALDSDATTDIGYENYFEITTEIDVTELDYNDVGTLTVTVKCIETIDDNMTLTYNFNLQGHTDPTMVKTGNVE